jgi:transposase
MKHPVYVRPVTDAERAQFVAGLRSSDAFVHRRCQILLASARGEQAPQIACHLGCDTQTVRGVWLRFVAGRPMSARTIEFLAWCCRQLAAAGKEALLQVWDNAPWHGSRAVRQWVRAHNRQVKATGQGVRLLPSYLPSKSPWLNPIEAKWAHGKRRVVEPARLLTAAELRARVGAAFDCPEED